jgi:hypothetical protein
MKKVLVAIALLGLFTIPASANPLIPTSAAIHVAAHGRDIIQVKKKWGVRPYGWNRGRKVGWRGLGMPPGQAKKMWR